MKAATISERAGGRVSRELNAVGGGGRGVGGVMGGASDDIRMHPVPWP